MTRRPRNERSQPLRPDCLEPRRLLASIFGTVFDDANDNGVKNTGEVGLWGWTVYDDANWNGVLDSGDVSTVTDGNGNYSLSRSSSSGSTSHNIRVVQQSPWRVSTASNYVFYNDGSVHYNVNFGQTQRGMVSGTVFEDKNLNGVKHSSEPALANRRVFIDENWNYAYDAGEPTALTLSNGSYAIRNLEPYYNYVVRLEPSAGYFVSTPGVGYYNPYVDVGSNVSGLVFAQTKSLFAPRDVAATRLSSGTQVNLTWEAEGVEGETGFRVEYSANNGSWTTLGTAAANAESFSASGLSATTDYRFRVFAYNASGDSYPSNLANPEAPAIPTDLRSWSERGFNRITWTGAPNATSYNIYRATTLNDPPVLYRTGVTGTSFTDTSITNGTTYYYSVAAVRPGVASGISAVSATSAEIQATAPTGYYTSIGVVPFGKFRTIYAHFEPDNFVDGGWEEHQIGIEKFDPAYGTLLSATGDVWLWQVFTAFNIGGSATAAPYQYTGWAQTTFNDISPFTGPLIDIMRTGTEPQGKVSLTGKAEVRGFGVGDDGMGGGMNSIRVQNRIAACCSNSVAMSVHGFYTAFFAVTYEYDPNPAPPPPMAMSTAGSKQEAPSGFFQEEAGIL
jgi:hypothetical protein